MCGCAPGYAPQPESARPHILGNIHRTTPGEPEMPGAARRLAAVVSRRDVQWLPGRVDVPLALQQALSSARAPGRARLLRTLRRLPGGNPLAAVRLALEPRSARPA